MERSARILSQAALQSLQDLKGYKNIMDRCHQVDGISYTFCKSTRQAKFDTEANLYERMKKTGKESVQHPRLFPSTFDKVCFWSEDILFEECIKGLDFYFCCKKLKIGLIVSSRLFLVNSFKVGKFQNITYRSSPRYSRQFCWLIEFGEANATR